MGVLDEAIRDHLELRRRHGASDAEIARAEAEALGPARRDPAADIFPEEGADGGAADETTVLDPVGGDEHERDDQPILPRDDLDLDGETAVFDAEQALDSPGATHEAPVEDDRGIEDDRPIEDSPVGEPPVDEPPVEDDPVIDDPPDGPEPPSEEHHRH